MIILRPPPPLFRQSLKCYAFFNFSLSQVFISLFNPIAFFYPIELSQVSVLFSFYPIASNQVFVCFSPNIIKSSVSLCFSPNIIM